MSILDDKNARTLKIEGTVTDDPEQGCADPEVGLGDQHRDAEARSLVNSAESIKAHAVTMEHVGGC